MSKKNIALVLSGGGVRAMVFHCGVLRWLAENDKLEEVSHISSVSGGSLLIGLILKNNSWKWPSSKEYKNKISPIIKKTLTEKNLQTRSFFRLFIPNNWKFILSRANILAKSIEKDWKIYENLDVLKGSPEWSINGTTAETGRRFRFKNSELGDYELGYANANNFKIAEAMSASAAFPIGLGPLSITTSSYIWKKKKTWNSSSSKKVDIKYKKLHIYDGGIYDNLGLEPFFKIGKDSFKKDISGIIVSDGGSPLSRISLKSIIHVFRVKRILDIALDQTRSLRIRSFVNFLNTIQGSLSSYYQIGSNPIEQANIYLKDKPLNMKNFKEHKWLSDKKINHAVSYPTNLVKISNDSFDILEQHGYETAKWNFLIFKKDK